MKGKPMTGVPIYFDPELSQQEVMELFASVGYMVTGEAGRLTAAPVPKFLRPDPAPNVRELPVPLVLAQRKVAR